MAGPTNAKLKKWVKHQLSLHNVQCMCDDCRSARAVKSSMMRHGDWGRRGNCYVTCEALYHLLGGKANKWKPMVMRHEGDTHWFLLRDTKICTPLIIDPTVRQFRTVPDYTKAKGCGFLTKKPSKRAKAMMETMVWQ
jgi:hypothetical protein